MEVELASDPPLCEQEPPICTEGFVYILKLEHGSWYVGWTRDPETRIASHFLGRGAQWTRLHPPLSVFGIQPGDTVLENVMTIALMAKHGYQRVRGGRHVEISMPCAPPPLLKALALRPPPPLPDDTEAEIVHDHAVVLTRLRDLDGPQAWRARVSGPRAAITCPRRGFKAIFADSEAALRVAVTAWLEEGNIAS